MRGLEHDRRTGGVILHPTSLPGPYGIGDLGPVAQHWVDLLGDSRTGLWQLLPLGPTGYGDSPYASSSSFAGNAMLIAPDSLREDGLLGTMEPPANSHPGFVDYGAAGAWKQDLIRRSAEEFRRRLSASSMRDMFDTFRAEQASWLDDYALFIALRAQHSGASWITWSDGLRNRDPRTLEDARSTLANEIDVVAFAQFIFFQQWGRLHAHAIRRGVRIIGDVPIFVTTDSADVWTRRDLFALDGEGRPEFLTGVPPDTFSANGQLWGGPQYRWDRHADDSYAWWISRFRAVLGMVDIVRIDHFRAFANYWEIPAGASSARIGVWRDGPGRAFFDVIDQHIGGVQIIAEDLGDPSPRVPQLLEDVGLPGMRLLQQAWQGDDTHPFLPANYPLNTVAYTGTHDNDTSLGWWRTTNAETRRRVSDSIDLDLDDPVGSLLEALWKSRAQFAIAPIQDLLRLGSEARLNTPGTPSGNWRWRVTHDQLGEGLRDELLRLNEDYARSTSPS